MVSALAPGVRPKDWLSTTFKVQAFDLHKAFAR
jgi:hypothetical protein